MDSDSKDVISKGEGQDMISNLPHFIVGRILSLVPTKDAIRTSVLSKRWIHLWTFITKLHFEDTHCRSEIRQTHFLKLVYRALVLLNASSIQSFSLSLSESYNPCHFNELVSDILNRRVKELNIVSKEKLNFWHYLWQTRSLEKLVLNMKDCPTIVPTSNICLPHLTVLKLFGITFIWDFCKDPENLSLNFPLLKEYETKNCTWLNVKGVTFEVPLLEVLSIEHSKYDESHSIIKYCAPRLAEFSYSGLIMQDTILFELDISTTRITSAIIDPFQFDDEVNAFLSCELMKQFSNNVECLKFEKSEVLALVQDDLPAFGILTRLELGYVTAEFLLIFLRNTPSLKTLIFKALLRSHEELFNPENVPSWFMSENVPCCFISNLKDVSFGRLNGDEYELRFAKFVMENVQVLEKASFFPTSYLGGSDFEKVREKILSFKSSVTFAFIPLNSY